MFLERDQEISEDREAVAIKVAKILSTNNKKKLQKLKVFLNEIL